MTCFTAASGFGGDAGSLGGISLPLTNAGALDAEFWNLPINADETSGLAESAWLINPALASDRVLNGGGIESRVENDSATRGDGTGTRTSDGVSTGASEGMGVAWSLVMMLGIVAFGASVADSASAKGISVSVVALAMFAVFFSARFPCPATAVASSSVRAGSVGSGGSEPVFDAFNKVLAKLLEPGPATWKGRVDRAVGPEDATSS